VERNVLADVDARHRETEYASDMAADNIAKQVFGDGASASRPAVDGPDATAVGRREPTHLNTGDGGREVNPTNNEGGQIPDEDSHDDITLDNNATKENVPGLPRRAIPVRPRRQSTGQVS